MPSPSLTHLYFESARTSKVWVVGLGCSFAVHLGFTLLPLKHVGPQHQTIAFADGDAGVQVELIPGDAPSSAPGGAADSPAVVEKLVAEIEPSPPTPVLRTDDVAFAEPVARPAKAISRKSSTVASRSFPAPDQGSRASRAGSAAAQPATQIITTQPPYPSEARELGREGIVRLRVRVGVDGCPREVEIASSSGRSDFDNISLATVKRQWRFRAARAALGHPVESTVTVTIRFQLHS